MYKKISIALFPLILFFPSAVFSCKPVLQVNGTDVPVVSKMNGREIEGAKGKSTAAGTRIPLIVKWSGVIQPGTVNEDLIDFSDFLPTICGAAGISVDAIELDGNLKKLPLADPFRTPLSPIR